MAIVVVRNVLCPPPTLTNFMAATARGEYQLQEPPRRRRPQAEGLRALLKDWVLN